MTYVDPLDLTLIPIDGPIVDVWESAIVVPSAEGLLAPLWTTPAELEQAKRLIAAVEEDIRAEYASGDSSRTRAAKPPLPAPPETRSPVGTPPRSI